MASTIDNSNIIELNEKDVPGAALNKSPEASSVLEVKRWLECHRELPFCIIAKFDLVTDHGLYSDKQRRGS